MNTKHTPGPWKACDYGRDSYGLQMSTVAADGGCNRICELVPHGKPSLDEETVANAQLIAASPELLAALQRLLEWVDPYAVPGCDENEEDMARARAAIAKATGGEP